MKPKILGKGVEGDETPVYMYYPEKSDILKFHKLTEILTGLRMMEHPKDKAILKAKADELAAALKGKVDKHKREFLRNITMEVPDIVAPPEEEIVEVEKAPKKPVETKRPKP